MTPSRLVEWRRRVVGALPARLTGELDLRRPSVWAGFGGPMNGQSARLAVVSRLLTSGTFEAVVETGTFRGATTEYLALVSGLPVASCDTSERSLVFARRRLASVGGVRLTCADSPSFLAGLAAAGRGEASTFFYLDAHWEAHLPLRDELAVIAAAWPRSVVLVDDVEVPGDPGYGYDDWGPGAALTPAYLDTTAAASWPRWYPSVPSSDETGARRGCVLLATPDQPDLDALVAAALR
jgi:hypothetical protein